MILCEILDLGKRFEVGPISATQAQAGGSEAGGVVPLGGGAPPAGAAIGGTGGLGWAVPTGTQWPEGVDGAGAPPLGDGVGAPGGTGGSGMPAIGGWPGGRGWPATGG